MGGRGEEDDEEDGSHDGGGRLAVVGVQQRGVDELEALDAERAQTSPHHQRMHLGTVRRDRRVRIDRRARIRKMRRVKEDQEE